MTELKGKFPQNERTPLDTLLESGSYGTASKKLELGETFVKEDSINNFLTTLPALPLSKHHEGEILALTRDLIKFGSNVNYKSKDGESPLLSAVSNRYPNRNILRGVVQLLVEDGKAEVTEEAIDHARLNGDDKMKEFLELHSDIKMLVAKTAKLTAKVPKGRAKKVTTKKATPKKIKTKKTTSKSKATTKKKKKAQPTAA